MDPKNKNVVIMAYQYSVVLKGIEVRLKERGYSVENITWDLDKVREIAERTSLFVVNVPVEINESIGMMDLLSAIASAVMAGRSDMIMIGEKSSRDILMENHVALRAFEWVERPVNMDDFIELVDKMTGYAYKRDLLKVQKDLE